MTEMAAGIKGVVRRGVQEKRFKSGEQWEVLRREGGAVIVKKGGVEKELPLDQARKFRVYKSEKITLSIGDRIRFTKNFKHRGKSFLNNELRTVTGIDESKIIFDKRRDCSKRRRSAYRPGNSCHQSRQPGEDCRPGHCQRAGSGVQPSERGTILRLDVAREMGDARLY